MEWTTESVLLKNEFRVADLLLLVSRLNGMPNELNPILYTQDKLAHLSRCHVKHSAALSNNWRRRGMIEMVITCIDIINEDKLNALYI
ncbi:hypothetical protein O9992_20995 [Vibrio lentus]|nr:hypothetical protein [Vibrio lentus]